MLTLHEIKNVMNMPGDKILPFHFLLSRNIGNSSDVSHNNL